jgi:hypothetical protein
MDAKALAAASREDLLQRIADLEAALAQRDAVIGELQKRLTALERRVGSSGGAGANRCASSSRPERRP